MFDEASGRGGLKRLSAEGKEKLDGAAGISLSSVLLERRASRIEQLNQQAVKAAHYQTKAWMQAWSGQALDIVNGFTVGLMCRDEMTVGLACKHETGTTLSTGE